MTANRLALLAVVPTLALFALLPGVIAQTNAAARLDSQTSMDLAAVRAETVGVRQTHRERIGGQTRALAAIARERQAVERARRTMREAVVEADGRIAAMGVQIGQRLIDAASAAGARSGAEAIGCAAEALAATARHQAHEADLRAAAIVIECGRLQHASADPLARLVLAEEDMARTAATVIRLQQQWYRILVTHPSTGPHHIPRRRVTGKVTRVLDSGAIVIDRGRQHTMRLGHKLVLSRGKHFVAVVEVYLVNEATCVARLSKGAKGRGWPPRPGDVAATDNPRPR